MNWQGRKNRFLGKKHVKYLGLVWDTEKDLFLFSRKLTSYSKFTMRNCLAFMAELFDPLGILLPVTIRSRLFLQKMHKIGMQWNDLLPSDLLDEWNSLMEDLVLCINISFKRVVAVADFSLHIFSDASIKSIRMCSICCIRWRTNVTYS